MADLDDLTALLGQFISEKDPGESSSGNEEQGSEGIFGDIDIETILKLMEAFSQINSNDKNTELLLALKPHLRAENRAKVDRAVKLMKLMSVFMILRESGLTDKMI